MSSGAIAVIRPDGHQVVLYTHSWGHHVEEAVFKAVCSVPGRARLTDPDYFTRILFDHLAGYYEGKSPSEFGYGIGTFVPRSVDCPVVEIRYSEWDGAPTINDIPAVTWVVAKKEAMKR